jgi:ATP-dependent DNA ligase
MTDYNHTKRLSGVLPSRYITPCRQHRRRTGAAVRPLVGLDSCASGAILDRMLPRPRSRPLSNFIEPCLPRRAEKPPAGRDWIHEIKHDGFRIMARRDAASVRLLTRNGQDFAGRFPLAAAAVAALPARSCLIDGEAIVTDRNGLAVFDLIRGHRPTAAVLCAFDLIELDGEDLRREPIETRKSTLKSLLRGKHEGIAHAHRFLSGSPFYVAAKSARFDCLA